MKRLLIWLQTISLAALLGACSKPDPGVNTNVPNVDLTFDYTWGTPPGSSDQPLTSDKTFKMIVREFATGLPVEGAKLVFLNNGNRTDSLISDAQGEITITGRDVAGNKTMVGGNGYWFHTDLPYTFDLPARLDSVYRTPTVDSVVTYLFPVSWLKVKVSSAAPYPDSSYYETKIFQRYKVYAGVALIPQLINPAKDTTLYYPVYGNDSTEVAVYLRQGSTELRSVQSPSVRTRGRGDTTFLVMKL